MPYVEKNPARTTAYLATERIWLGPDGKVYKDGRQPDGSTLLATPGKSLSNDQVAQYGLAKDAPAEEKALEKSEDKAEDAPANKARALSTQAVKVTPARRPAPRGK